MAEPAFQGMTVDDFLNWEDGTDTRYQLIGGYVVAMTPPMPAHGRLAARLAGALDAALRPRRPCAVQSETGIVRPDRNDTCYIADLAVTCEELRADDRLIRNPVLIVEIQSPSTTAFDRLTKIADYRSIPSVQEILLIDSQSIVAEVLRREGERWITEIVRGPAATLSLMTVPLNLSMAELYEGVPLPEPRPRQATTA